MVSHHGMMLRYECDVFERVVCDKIDINDVLA